MAGLVPAIHLFFEIQKSDVDARDKLVLGPRASARTRVRGHDEPVAIS